ncbi:MAG TPA: polysaccharide pyruvyl transferase family protein, partial [Thermoanaerobaculia bacterium]|nr:polysaccharide pyruvyl transferase family protein [Thermoanaerobaculia bacterium]
RVDWLVGEPGRPRSATAARLTVRVRTAVQALLGAAPALRRHLGHHVASSFDLLARRRFERGLRILSRGRVVITDRLHGHVLALLLGMPHVVLDNHYGKIADYRRRFTADTGGVEAAADAAGALAAAERLLAAETGNSR